MLAYLAGPIDDVEPDKKAWWVDELCKILVEIGVNCYRPVHAVFQSNILHADGAAICAINRHAIKCCDVMIAYLAGSGRGFGTIREIEHAARCGKRIVVIGALVSLESHDVEQVDPALFLRAETWRRLLGRPGPPADLQDVGGVVRVR